MSAIDSFVAAIRAAGLVPPDHVIFDGHIHRFSSNGKVADDAGYYVLHDGVIPAGCFGCWRTGIKEVWRQDVGRDLSAEELAAIHERAKADRAAREEEEHRFREEAALQADDLWQRAKPAHANHPYLLAKKIKPNGARRWGGRLVLPLWDGSRLQSLQFIDAGGEKRLLRGGAVTGLYYSIGTPDSSIVICEGFATACTVHEATELAAVVAFNAGNLRPVAQRIRQRFPDAKLVIAADDDYRVEGNPGITKAAEAARASGAEVAQPDFGDDRPDGATDFNDLARHRGAEFVKKIIDAAIRALDTRSGADDEIELTRLANLKALDYERARKQAASALGIRASLLDKVIGKMRGESGEDNDLQGASLRLTPIEPWGESVDGAKLLADLVASARRYIVLPPCADTAIALWVVFTHAIDAAHVAPLLTITAPEKRCGKSTLLDWLRRVVRIPLPMSNTSAAAVYRTIETWHPTLLLDEADTFMRDNLDLRNVVNSGHSRGSAFVLRTEGDHHEPRQFSTWSAKAIAQIGTPAATITDRSIVVRMRRRARSEKVERLRENTDAQAFKNLARQSARFAADHLPALKKARPALPEELGDRAQDNWELLIAIADQVGGEWPQRARTAAVTLSGAAADTDSLKVKLLADVRQIFIERGKTRLSSEDLVTALAVDPTKPWCELSRGKPITQHVLARMLGAFEIVPGTVRVDTGGTPKGYKFETVEHAFQRYGEAVETATRHNPSQTGYVARGVSQRGGGDTETFDPESAPEGRADDDEGEVETV